MTVVTPNRSPGFPASAIFFTTSERSWRPVKLLPMNKTCSVRGASAARHIDITKTIAARRRRFPRTIRLLLQAHACVPFHGIGIERDAEPRPVRNRQHAVRVEPPATLRQIVDEWRAGQVFHHIGADICRRELEIGSQSESGVPTVRDEADAALVGHPGDPPFF